MIHYHGGVITEANEAVKFYQRRDVLISFAKKEKEHLIAEVCRSFVLDNGAFSLWKSGKQTDWDGFYDWVEKWKNHPRFEWFLIPDVIGGSDEENQELMEHCPFPDHISVPVYHLGESFRRLSEMVERYPRIAIGSTQGFELKTIRFWNEMRKIFEVICDRDGIPQVKVHGLRMLDPEIVKAFPFSSGDSSTNVRESLFDIKWGHKYSPTSKAERAALVADYLDKAQSPSFYKLKPIQMELI
jgi:hypothetical protein